jgi:membrane protein YqaA with SNARE-associated domain
MGAPRKSFKFAFWCAVGPVAGGLGGYSLGYLAEPLGRWIIFDLMHYGSAGEKVAQLHGENALLAILAAAFTPIPGKMFTIAAGVFHEQVGLGTLVLATAIGRSGRSGRFFLVAGSICLFGPPIKRLLDHHLEVFTANRHGPARRRLRAAQGGAAVTRPRPAAGMQNGLSLPGAAESCRLLPRV